jgi:hypothetical protein
MNAERKTIRIPRTQAAGHLASFAKPLPGGCYDSFLEWITDPKSTSPGANEAPQSPGSSRPSLISPCGLISRALPENEDNGWYGEFP